MKKKPSDLYDKLVDVRPKKYTQGDKTLIVMPSPIIKKDLTDYTYGKDIDEKVIKMAAHIAEKMAASFARELVQSNTNLIVERVIEGITGKIEAAIPTQQTAIREVIKESSEQIKKDVQTDFNFNTPDIAIDRSKGLKLEGKIGKKTKKKGSINEQLDALDNLL